MRIGVSIERGPAGAGPLSHPASVAIPRMAPASCGFITFRFRTRGTMNTHLRRTATAALLSVLLPLGAAGQANDTIHYDVAFPNASRHEAEISVTYTNLPAQALGLRMSRSSPGRYALHEFAKN